MKFLRSKLIAFKRLGTTTRIAFAMAMWSATVLLSLTLLGVLDDGHNELLQQRTKLCESVAISCSQNVSSNQAETNQLLLEALKARNPDVLTVGFRSADGTLLYAVGNHSELWGDSKHAASQILVPVLDGDQLHANIEVTFEPIVAPGILGFFSLNSVRVTVIATLANLLGFSLWLRRCFSRLDPSQVIPARVRSALDTMAEVILVVDAKNQIMLANRRLTDLLGGDPDMYQGRPLKSLPWESDVEAVLLNSAKPTEENGDNLAAADADGEQPKLVLRVGPDEMHTYKLNASPILDDDGELRGRLLSLDDITAIEQKSTELRKALAVVQASKEEIAQQNEQLQFLATRDPMTGCWNRRSFFESFHKIWERKQRSDAPLSCAMVDVDHFKSINDNHGHATGDEVLKQVAKALLTTVGDAGIVCRYGGEEFCVLLPEHNLQGAKEIAERFRSAIAGLQFDELTVTASFGCSDRMQQADSAECMLDQADQALYHAKRSGRNRVCGFDDLAVAAPAGATTENVTPGQSAPLETQSLPAMTPAN